MKLVATLMVRDEVDIIAAVVEHHLDQGVDLIIATDNGSVDGTTQVLEQYAADGVVELHHDPVHLKQQRSVVTAMARRAFTEHGADWVLNIDADEFFVPVDRSLTLRAALEQIPTSLGAFTADVVNLVGPPAQAGSGLRRLTWRDHRTVAELNAVGIHAHPTPNAIHRGDADVTVAQGNHFVSIESTGTPDAAFAIEVLHLPWRSWGQLERKVVNAGRGYEANPELKPSKNHHGMADYRRYQGGRLRYTYLLRLPTPAQLKDGESSGSYQPEPWLAQHLEDLVARARHPELLRTCLDDSHDDVVPVEEHEQAAHIGAMFMVLEAERDEQSRLAEENHRKAARIAKERDEARAGLTPRRTAGRSFARRAVRSLRRRAKALRG